jgi:hypothetical protein
MFVTRLGDDTMLRGERVTTGRKMSLSRGFMSLWWMERYFVGLLALNVSTAADVCSENVLVLAARPLLHPLRQLLHLLVPDKSISFIRFRIGSLEIAHVKAAGYEVYLQIRCASERLAKVSGTTMNLCGISEVACAKPSSIG